MMLVCAENAVKHQSTN